MNSRITLAVIVVFSVMTTSMIPLQQQIQQNAFAQGDESDTDTEQRLGQKNVGSGDSPNFNCAEQLIKAGTDQQECDAVDSESATLSVCKEIRNFIGTPDEAIFTVTGNGPSPAQFEGDENCVDVTIGPGEYTVSEVFPLDNFGTEITGDCVHDPNNIRGAIGEIQTGETQECRFINFR